MLRRAECAKALVALCGLTAAALVHCNRAYGAGAAYQVDTAEVSEVGSCKVESWLSAAQNHDVIAAMAPACVVGLFRPIEVSAQINRTRADGEWVSGMTPSSRPT